VKSRIGSRGNVNEWKAQGKKAGRMGVRRSIAKKYTERIAVAYCKFIYQKNKWKSVKYICHVLFITDTFR